jgi:hypothetical protein
MQDRGEDFLKEAEEIKRESENDQNESKDTDKIFSAKKTEELINDPSTDLSQKQTNDSTAGSSSEGGMDN